MDLSFINALYCERDFSKSMIDLSPYLESLVTVVSIETVGFGDLAPKSTSARVFAVFYNTVGILNLGMAISTCRETIIESFEHSYRKRLENLLQSRLIRKERRIRKEAIKQALIDAGHNPYIYEQIEEVDQHENPEEQHTFFYQLTHGMKAAAAHARNGHKAILNVNALSPVQMEWVNQTVEERILHERELHQEYHAYPHMLQDESTVEEMREDLNTYGGTLKLLETLGLAGSTSAMEAEQRREFLVKVNLLLHLSSLERMLSSVRSCPQRGLYSYSSGS
jgi:potassium channel subfamily K